MAGQSAPAAGGIGLTSVTNLYAPAVAEPATPITAVDAVGLQQARWGISTGQFATISSVGVPLINPPGANRVIVPVDWWIWYKINASWGSSPLFSLEYNVAFATGLNILETLASNGGAAPTRRGMQTGRAAPFTGRTWNVDGVGDIRNIGIKLSGTADPVAGGNSQYVVSVVFFVMPVLAG